MATKKKQIAFYADDYVAEWYEKLAPGEGTRRINEWVHAAIEAERTKEERINSLEKQVKELERLSESDASITTAILNALKDLAKQQARIYSFGRCGPVNEIEKEYDRLNSEIVIASRDHLIRNI
ncbi:MAG: hypothetical protein WCT03_03255 [Candidatus Obscuribacterales bacterium]|jgi:hypothetical protein